MKREYFIAQYSIKREWSIFRQSGDTVQWLSPEKVWTKEKRYAMKFISEQDAVSALSIVKTKKWLKTEEEYIDEVITGNKEKRSWWELSDE